MALRSEVTGNVNVAQLGKNTTALHFQLTFDNITGWEEGQIYIVDMECQDEQGNILSNDLCQVTTPSTYSTPPVDLFLSSLIPGAQYSLDLKDIAFRQSPTSTGLKASFPVTTYCTGW